MYLKVFVTPGARRESVEEKDKALTISVREPAERNRANVRACELVASRLKVPVERVRILSGHHTRGKMLSIRD